jgi:Rad51 protein
LEKTQQQLSQLLPKFQTADEFTRLTLGIEKMDSIISFTDGETVSIVGDTKYSQIVLTRLCVRALTPIRHGGCGFSNVIIIDAGNSSDIYQYVNFARQYGLDINKILQSIIVSRPFTIYQLAQLIIYQLPTIIQKSNDNVKMLIVPDLLSMFLKDPQVKAKEARIILRQIVSSIRKISLNNNILSLVALPYHDKQSSIYDKSLLSRFDKHIEITRVDPPLFDIKMINKSRYQQNKFSLQETDLMITDTVR